MTPPRTIPRSIPRRRPPLDQVGKPLAAITRKAFSKFGFVDDHVLKRWPEVVGPELARLTAPERISKPSGKAAADGATLTVRVAGAAALEVQHMAPEIVSRINRFYGRQVIARLKLVQGPLPETARSRRRKAPPPLPESDERRLEDAAKGIEDPGLAAALARLGRAVLTDRNQ